MKKLFMLLSFVLTVQIASAQVVRVTLHEDGVSLKTVLTQMEKQTGYSFYYNNADIDDASLIRGPANICTKSHNNDRKQLTLCSKSHNKPFSS